MNCFLKCYEYNNKDLCRNKTANIGKMFAKVKIKIEIVTNNPVCLNPR